MYVCTYCTYHQPWDDSQEGFPGPPHAVWVLYPALPFLSAAPASCWSGMAHAHAHLTITGESTAKSSALTIGMVTMLGRDA